MRARIFLAAALIILDQITKAVLAPRDFFFGPVRFALVKNYGLPFAINSSATISLVVVGAVFLLLVFYFIRRREHFSAVQTTGLAVVFAGAISNLLDRIALGYVRDIMDAGLGFAFNPADLLIVIGLLMVLLVSNSKTAPA